MVVAAPHATLHQMGFFSGDTTGFSKRAQASRHNLGAYTGVHGTVETLEGAESCMAGPPSVLSGQGAATQPPHTAESLQTPSGSHILRRGAKLRVPSSRLQRPSCRRKQAQPLCSTFEKKHNEINVFFHLPQPWVMKH